MTETFSASILLLKFLEWRDCCIPQGTYVQGGYLSYKNALPSENQKSTLIENTSFLPVNRSREVENPIETTMDLPDPHGGGDAHASTAENRNVASQLTAMLGVLGTLTPSQWTGIGLLGAVMGEEEYGNENAMELTQRPPKATGNKVLGQIRTQRRLGGKNPYEPPEGISANNSRH